MCLTFKLLVTLQLYILEIKGDQFMYKNVISIICYIL